MQNDPAKIIRDAGLKATKPRMAIFSALQKSKYPINIKDICRKLRQSGTDQVTTYRTLATFKKLGIATQVDFKHRSAYYELHGNGNDHHHIICNKCHKIENFEGCQHEKLAKKALKQVSHFAKITNHSF